MVPEKLTTIKIHAVLGEMVAVLSSSMDNN
jgi:hypothetical protein